MRPGFAHGPVVHVKVARRLACRPVTLDVIVNVIDSAFSSRQCNRRSWWSYEWNACFSDAGVLFAARTCALSRDLEAGAQVDKSHDIPTVVCSLSRDEIV